MGDSRQYYVNHINVAYSHVQSPVIDEQPHAKRKVVYDEYKRQVNQPETYFVLSSVVTVCFNCPIGIVALFCSWDAHKAFDRGDMKAGRAKAKWAFCLSMFSMVLTVVIVMAVVFYMAYVEAIEK